MQAGASIVNDVSALRADPEMAAVVADSGVRCCLMHMLGEPRTMQEHPRYGDVVDEVRAFLQARIEFAVSRRDRARSGSSSTRASGSARARAHNLELLMGLAEIASLGRPLLIGTSRKSFIGRIIGEAAGAARARRRRAPARRNDRDERDRAGARREHLPRARRRAGARCARGCGCYVGRGMNDELPEDPDDLDDDRDLDGEDEDVEDAAESVTIEISGLSLYTHHGVSEAEREVGQRLVIDMRLDVGETDATVTDSIEDTVDYAEVCQLVALVAQQRSHRTLERLCSSIADRLLADYELEGVWVKASKPQPPIPLSVDEVSVEVWREASD